MWRQHWLWWRGRGHWVSVRILLVGNMRNWFRIPKLGSVHFTMVGIRIVLRRWRVVIMRRWGRLIVFRLRCWIVIILWRWWRRRMVSMFSMVGLTILLYIVAE